MPRTTPRAEREWLSCTKRSCARIPSCSCHSLAVGLHEEAALVAVHRRLERNEAVETQGPGLHERGG